MLCPTYIPNWLCLPVGSLDKSVIIWEMPRDILTRSQAEESLRGRQDKVDYHALAFG